MNIQSPSELQAWPRVAPVPPADLSQSERDYAFDLLGYNVLRGALDARQLREINAWVDAQPPRKVGQWSGEVQVQSYQGHDGTNYQNIIAGGEVFEEMIDNPAWIDEVGRYIRNDYNRLRVQEAFLNVRGQSGFIGIHSGGAASPAPVLTFRHHTGRWFVGQINILMALTDIGPGDGATVVIPGSHKSHIVHPCLENQQFDTYRDDRAAGSELFTQEVYLKAGEALMFTDALMHGSAARINAGERRVMIYRYTSHLIESRFNFVPSNEFLGRLTPARRNLVQNVAPRVPPAASAA